MVEIPQLDDQRRVLGSQLSQQRFQLATRSAISLQKVNNFMQKVNNFMRKGGKTCNYASGGLHVYTFKPSSFKLGEVDDIDGIAERARRFFDFSIGWLKRGKKARSTSSTTSAQHVKKEETQMLNMCTAPHRNHALCRRAGYKQLARDDDDTCRPWPTHFNIACCSKCSRRTTKGGRSLGKAPRLRTSF